jgi:predicted RNase H-like nuclease (RuvC/YqgF family)
MPRRSNGTFVESLEEYRMRLLCEIAQKEDEIQKLKEELTSLRSRTTEQDRRKIVDDYRLLK